MEQVLRTQTQAITGPSGSAISAWRWRPTPISPRRSAAMPTCSSTARWSAPTSSARAGCRRARTSACRGDRRADLHARAPRDGGRARHDRPLCRRLSLPTRSASWSNAGSPACSRSASSPRSRASAATGWCLADARARNISATTRRRGSWSARRRGETYRVGQRLTLRLAEANPVSGSLRFELPEGSYGGARPTPAAPRPRPRTAAAAAGRRTSATIPDAAENSYEPL